jgi:hypothetical protein
VTDPAPDVPEPRQARLQSATDGGGGVHQPATVVQAAQLP